MSDCGGDDGGGDFGFDLGGMFGGFFGGGDGDDGGDDGGGGGDGGSVGSDGDDGGGSSGSDGDDGDGDPGEYTEVTHESYSDKMQDSMASVCGGILLFIAGFGILFWNEGRAVQRQKDIDAGRGIVQQIGLVTPNGAVQNSFDNKLVYVTGRLDAGNDVLYDSLFDINVTEATGGALKYDRNVQAYQWREQSSTKEEKTLGGGTKKTTTYSYDKVWSSSRISSSNFKKEVTPSNPTSFLVSGTRLVSSDIGLGPYGLSTDIKSRINWKTSWDAPVDPNSLNFTGYTTSKVGSELVIQQSPGSNKIGDHRVDFSIVMPDDISVVAKQGSTGQLEPYIMEDNRELWLFSRGTVSSDELFSDAEWDNILLTWFYRFLGFFCMYFGIITILNPIEVAFDILPFCGDAIGDMVGGIITCIACCIAVPLSLMVISIAWFFYRPYYAAGAVVMLGLLGLFFFKYMKPKLSKPPPGQNPSDDDPEEAKPTNQEFNEHDVVAQPEATAVPVGYEQPYNKAEQQSTPAFSQSLNNPPPSTYNYGSPSTNPGFSPTPSYPPPATNNGGGYVAP